MYTIRRVQIQSSICVSIIHVQRRDERRILFSSHKMFMVNNPELFLIMLKSYLMKNRSDEFETKTFQQSLSFQLYGDVTPVVCLHVHMYACAFFAI